MNDKSNVALLEKRLRAAIGSPKPPDFDAWQAKHTEAIARLTPAITARQHRKQKLLMWTARAAMALAVSVLVLLGMNLDGEKESFAQAVKAAKGAQTLTETRSSYERLHSTDGQRSWLRIQRTNVAFQRPGLYRETGFDEHGNLNTVEIADLEKKKFLFLDMKSKKATWRNKPTFDYGPDGPIFSSTKLLDLKDIQLVGQRKVGDANANVFRWRGSAPGSADFWVDAKSKQLLGYSSPSAAVFDPSTAADRNNLAEKTFSHGQIAGSITDNIVVDAKLDDDLFNMKVPEGFEVIVEAPRPTVTEADLIDFLGACARFNDGVFPDTYRGIETKEINKAEEKKKADRTEVEQKLIDLEYKHIANHNGLPIVVFAQDNAVPKTFRYIGKGVKLGDADRIVCWYKLKSIGKYRAVYGDLTFKDVDPKDLPLPVEK